MYTLKSLTTFSIVLLASIVTPSVFVRLHVESGQDILEALPQEHISSGLDLFDYSSDSDVLQLSRVSVDPDPPLKGQSVTVKINGTTTKTIEDRGSISVTAKMGLTTVLKTTYQICELDGVECPLTLDKEEVAITFDLGTATATDYTVNIRAVNYDNKALTCIGGFVTVK